jgi:hypothetical protein
LPAKSSSDTAAQALLDTHIMVQPAASIAVGRKPALASVAPAYIRTLDTRVLGVLDKCFAVVPHLIIGTELLLFCSLFRQFDALKLVAMALLPYALPLTLYRVVTAFHPLREGFLYYEPERPSIWVLASRLQILYAAFPVLERLLIVLGFYSAWLRLWGSHVGKNVLWSPQTQLLDRAGVDIGDGCFIGQNCTFSSYVTHPRRGKHFIYYSKVKLGENVFVGAFSKFGPGTRIAAHTQVPSLTNLLMNREVSNDSFSPKKSI